MCILLNLWNNGSITALTPGEILEKCGRGAYGNHRKLSIPPWSLVENVNSTSKRNLSAKGIQFMKNEIRIPRTIIEDPINGSYLSKSDTDLIKIAELIEEVK